jgi:zinc transporter
MQTIDPQSPVPTNPALSLTEDALICGYQIPESGPNRPVSTLEMEDALAEERAVTWLHFRLANVRAEHFLHASTLVPDSLRERIVERDGRSVVEATEGGLIVVSGDLSFDHAADPGETAEVWAYATPRYLLRARTHALHSADALRLALRDGLRVASGVELLAVLLEARSGALRRIEDEMVDEVDEIEDEILRGDIKEQRARLGRIRRRCARIRRHFVPDRVALQRCLARPPVWLGDEDAERMRSIAEETGFLIDDANELYERAKLLQEELASRLAEKTSDRLYVLSILSAVLLPMTLITGIFGMNIGGLPLTEGESSFWWSMLLILAAGGLTLWILRRLKLL